MYRLLFLLFLFACNDNECKKCFIGTETNEYQAKLKCSGLSNNYPDMDYTEDFEGTMCGDEIEDFVRKQGIQGSITNYCGLRITTKYHRVCR